MKSKAALSKAKFISIFCAIFLGLTSLAVVAWQSKGDWASALALVYAILVTVFLAVQLWAFVLSQVNYSSEVENRKFQVLEVEGSDWKSQADHIPLACLFCGVDSAPMIRFFVFLVGSGLLASTLILIWALKNNKFENESSASRIPMNVEGDQV